MRNLWKIAAVAIGIFVATGAALASEVTATPESVWRDVRKIVGSLRARQDTYCAAPRSNTSEKCNEDFEAAYSMLWSYAGWRSMQIEDAVRGDVADYDDSRARREYWYPAAQRQLDFLESTYYPETTSSVDGKSTN